MNASFQATYIGVGDFHEEKFDHMEVVIPFSDFQFPEMTPEVAGHCTYSFHVFPGSKLKSDSQSDLPMLLTLFVAGTFFLMALAFFMYDRFVQRRNSKIVSAAATSNAIVSSLFPSNVRERLFTEKDTGKQLKNSMHCTTSRLKTFLNGGEDGDETLALVSKPIADLFPNTTILFMDIAGFTAWSSTREPTQVFMLLETLYQAFDEIAKRRRVFKVETIGDSYVAVTGLPDPRKDHAIVMARFARDCLHKMHRLTKMLELTLGPDTADLDMRIGLHSGPVTAGVLRGERSRFQLFGDTMNTASRMESHGIVGRIQLSQETADLLIAAGKESWLKPREEKVVAKGKGEMQTYWLSENSSMDSSERGSDSGYGVDANDMEYAVVSARVSRLIDWNVEVLNQMLRQILARRQTNLSKTGTPHQVKPFVRGDGTVLEEVTEIITLREFDAATTKNQIDSDSIQLSKAAEAQLFDYVTTIASLYHENPFHNFAHASHVTMSVVKLMSRIVALPDIEYDSDDTDRASILHDHTNGITSDPLTQFACVFSALIHDVDHPGIPNSQIVKEKAPIVAQYKGQSIAEQNSVDVAWHLLMHERYGDLRATIYKDETEMKRFRQLVVNSVMATDVMDNDLKALRNGRWDKAFADSPAEEETQDIVNRKATIVIEHIIQASDVAHTMQHWNIYRKWNKNLFEEMTLAFQEGRAERDPLEFWYEGELGSFDFYIIPLAKKLKDCGVFGVSSDEYLNYAMKNRKEWERCGREIVAEMKEAATAKALVGSVLPTPLLEEPKFVSATASHA
jgi:class 3 adenylate cyclase